MQMPWEWGGISKNSQENLGPWQLPSGVVWKSRPLQQGSPGFFVRELDWVQSPFILPHFPCSEPAACTKGIWAKWLLVAIRCLFVCLAALFVLNQARVHPPQQMWYLVAVL